MLMLFLLLSYEFVFSLYNRGWDWGLHLQARYARYMYVYDEICSTANKHSDFEIIKHEI